MGHRYVTASASIIPNITQTIKLTSVIVTPLSEAAVSAKATLYAATAATANTEIMHIACGTAPSTKVWNDPTGIELNKLYVTAASAYVTLVWN